MKENILKIETKVTPLGDGFADIYQDISGESTHRNITSEIIKIQDSQTKKALKGLGYVYLSPKWRIRILNELEDLNNGCYDLDETKDILEYLVKENK